MATLDIASIVESVQSALPEATPNPAAALFLAQIEHLGAVDGARVVSEMCANFPAACWGFDDERLRQWPAESAEVALRHVRRIPAGWMRIHSFCSLAEHLTPEERDEAFDGLLDGTLTSGSWSYNKPESFSELEDYLLLRMPPTRQDDWIRHRGALANRPLLDEIDARRRLARFPEERVRELFALLCNEWGLGESAPCGLEALWQALPADLKDLALERLRRLPLKDSWRFLAMSEQLSEDDYWRAMPPPEEATRYSLGSAARQIHRAPVGLVAAWLDAFLKAEVFFSVSQIVPHLAGIDRTRAQSALLTATLESAPDATAWDLVGDADLPALLWRLREDSYGYRRDELIAHIAESRGDVVVDKCFIPMLSELNQRPPDHRLEIVAAMTPWLALKTSGQLPASIASLPIRPSGKRENRQYWLVRVVAEGA